jgi:hypothetical protein
VHALQRETILSMRMLHVSSLLVCLASLAQAEAQAPAGPPDASVGYTGVVPGSNTVPDNLPPPGITGAVSWPGFQMSPDGGSRVFIQTTIEVTPELKKEGENWQLVLANVTLPPGNTRRPMDMQFFNTPVRSMRAVKRGNTVVVTLHMRAKVQPVMRTERADSGYYFTYLEFPAGKYLTEPDAGVDAGPQP